MFKHKKRLTVLSSITLALVVGAAALFSPSAVYAQAEAHGGPGGRGGMMGIRGADDAYLAQALGITEEQLDAAKDAAWDKIVDQALADGLITEAQAASLKENSDGFRGRGLNGWLVNETNVDYEASLAAELGITVDELDAARTNAHALQLQAAVDSGALTAEQAEQMRAHMAVRSYIDRETMLANALGISVEDLQAARAEGKSPSDLITELGLNTEDVTTALKAALSEVINQAVADGKLTQEQADLLLADEHFNNVDSFFGGRRGMDRSGDEKMPGERGGRGMRGMRGGEFTPPSSDN